MADTELTSAQVVEATGASYRQIDYWARNGVFGEELAGSGSGSYRRWPPTCIEAIMAMVDLQQFLGQLQHSNGRGANAEVLHDIWTTILPTPVQPGEVLVVTRNEAFRFAEGTATIPQPYISIPLRRAAPGTPGDPQSDA